MHIILYNIDLLYFNLQLLNYLIKCYRLHNPKKRGIFSEFKDNEKEGELNKLQWIDALSGITASSCLS